tara:strand:+ start:384 stop:503 length:120 start_codon:yes stop_codon:yes gene_type:complete
MIRKVIPILPLALALACGDEEEKDSGADTGIVEEAAEAE